MKTKAIELYADLLPGWHDHPKDHIYVHATTQPDAEKLPQALRVKIMVELPEHHREIPSDETVQATAVPVSQ